MELRHIICAVGLLVAGIGYASAGSVKNTGAEGRKETKESAAVQLLTGSKRDGGGRLSMKCSIARCGTAVVLRARILKGDFAVQVARPGLRLALENGGSVTLVPERRASCCGDWAKGRWNNVSFRLSGSDVELLKKYGIVSIAVSAGGGEEIKRDIASDRQDAIGELLRAVAAQ